MKNLIKLIKAENQKLINDFKIQLATEKSENLNNWQYLNIMPKGSKKVFASEQDKKAYLLERYILDKNKAEIKQLAKVATITNSTNLIGSIVVTVEWKKNRTWGSNPRAEAQIRFKNGLCEYFNSGSVGGCGYDKESTAIANVLNQCNELKKLMYTKKDKKSKLLNRDIFGYGSGYGILPYIEGGVGASCYYKIFESLGFKFEKTASGKTFDVYKATNKK